MLGVERALEVATSALHIVGGLSGAVAHAIQGDTGGAILIALTIAGSILILAGAVALAEITRFKVRQIVRKHEKPGLSEPRDKGGLDA
jgi:hypothetical protein